MKFEDLLNLSNKSGPGAEAAIAMLRRAVADDLLTRKELANLYLAGPAELKPDVVAAAEAPEHAVNMFIRKARTLEQLRAFLGGRSPMARDPWWVISLLAMHSGRGDVIRAVASTMDASHLTAEELRERAPPREAVIGLAENLTAAPDVLLAIIVAAAPDDEAGVLAARNPVLSSTGARAALRAVASTGAMHDGRVLAALRERAGDV